MCYAILLTCSDCGVNLLHIRIEYASMQVDNTVLSVQFCASL